MPANQQNGANRVRSIRERWRLNQPAMARAIGVSTRKLSALESQNTPARPETERRITEIQRLYDALSELTPPDALGGWLERPNDAFGGATPLQLVERGEIDRLWTMIHELRTGHPA